MQDQDLTESSGPNSGNKTQQDKSCVQNVSVQNIHFIHKCSFVVTLNSNSIWGMAPKLIPQALGWQEWGSDAQKRLQSQIFPSSLERFSFPEALEDTELRTSESSLKKTINLARFNPV